MKKEQLANEITGKNRRTDWFSKSLEQTAKDYGLIVIWGEADDMLEFGGAIKDEIGMYGGGHALLGMKKHGLGAISEETIKELNLALDDAGLPELNLKTVRIDVDWIDEGNPVWQIKTAIPHAYFVLMDEDNPEEIFCRGIVINSEDVLRAIGQTYSK